MESRTPSLLRRTLLLPVLFGACHPAPDGAKDDAADSVEVLLECFTDLDGDGFGAGIPNRLEACPPGTREEDGDCDESNYFVHPAALERCDGVDNNCDGSVDVNALDAVPSYADQDGDGAGGPEAQWSCEIPTGRVAESGDCEDEDPTIGPRALESCNNRDDDCDGLIDNSPVDGLSVWPDDDGDGFGNEAMEGTACALESGWVTQGRDCDDGNPAIHGGASETDCFDPIDYNCDGSIGLVDLDGDGFEACRECDDGDAGIFPGALEVCNGEDDDCDGLTDPPGSEGSSLWFEDADGDGWGVRDSVMWACVATPGWAGSEEDCDETNALVNPGASEVCDDGLDNDCDGTSNGCGVWGLQAIGAVADIVLYSPVPGTLGTEVRGAGDFDGLGGQDIMFSSPGESANGYHSGSVYVLSMVSSVQPSIANALAVFVGEDVWQQTGADIAELGDCSGDGRDDIAISAVWNGRGGTLAGAVYLIHGPRSGTHNLSTADAILMGEEGSQAGWSLSGGDDLTGDGVGDLLVGAPHYGPTPGRNDGIVYLLPCSASGLVDLADSPTRYMAEAADDALGVSVEQVGDMNGDGLGDIGIGASLSSLNGEYSGAVYFVTEPTLGDVSVADVAATVVGSWELNSTGHALAAAGDTDGDGYADVLVGAAGDSTFNSSNGAAQLLLGPPVDGSDMSIAHATWIGLGEYEGAGMAVAAGSDLDGDGWSDLAVGAPYTGGGNVSPSRVYVIYGPFSAGVHSLGDVDGILEGEAVGDWTGASVALPGDLNGDGFGDILVGAPEHDYSNYESGAVYIVFGGNL